MIELVVNGQKLHTQAETLIALLKEQGVIDKKYAVAVNESFVARAQYHDCQLSSGDRIELVTPMQGG